MYIGNRLSSQGTSVSKALSWPDSGERAISPSPGSAGDTLASTDYPLDHCPEAPAVARALAHRTLKDWGAENADTVILVVSELVTNAVEHALPPLALRLEQAAAGLRVSVTDGGPAPQEGSWIASCAPEEHGRGLLIVGVLAEARGTYRHAHGATHWASLPRGDRTDR
ncbi:ATP-binding protein [Streptomyces sp. NPDC051014]|uniref:ATP-binding protein n=1 Tax=Streptomyces sp. NPDC051014 TaxID=3155751 RepID=UPI0033FE8251